MKKIRVNIQRIINLFMILSLLALTIQPTINALADTSIPSVVNDGGDEYTHETDPDTGRVNFIHLDETVQSQELKRPANTQLNSVQREESVSSYLEKYAPEFGLVDPLRNLMIKDVPNQVDKREVYKYQQTYNDIPVMGGELIVNMALSGKLLSMNGELAPDLSLETAPLISAGEAVTTAKGIIAKYYQQDISALAVTDPELWIFDESLLMPSTRPAELVWRMQVSAPGEALNELVLINAQTGGVSLHFNQVDTGWESDVLNQEETPTDTPTEIPTETTPTEVPTEVSVTATPIPTEAPTPTEPPTDVPALAPSEEVNTLFSLGGTDRFVATTGTDTGNCTDSVNPCATMNYAIGQAVNGDTVNVAVGVYTGTGNEVVLINKNILFLGGWNETFITPVGFSVIDGEKIRHGIVLGVSVDTEIQGFVIKNGLDGIRSSSSGTNLKISNSSVIYNSNVGISVSGTLSLNNATVSNNLYGVGHNGYGATEIAIVNNSTIVNNSYGLHTNKSLYIRNSIVSNNKNMGIFTNCNGGSIYSSGYNIIDNMAGCNGLNPAAGDKFNVDPQLSPLLVEFGVHPVLSTSPAVDSGDPSTCFSMKDQRGIARYDGDGDSVIKCDIGAFEYMPAGAADHMVIVTGNDQSRAPNEMFTTPLQIMIVDQAGNPVSGIEVTFSAPGNGATIIFDETHSNVYASTTGLNGTASTALFSANNQLGNYIISATSIAGSIDFYLENVIWFVATTGLDTNSCKSLSNACGSIGQAIQNAKSGNTIYVAEGIYPNLSLLQIKKDLTIKGGWNSVFSAQIGRSIIDGQKLYPGVYIDKSNVVIERFTIKDVKPYFDWAAISNTGVLLLDNVEINGTLGRGVDNNGVLTLIGSVVTNNTSRGIVNRNTMIIDESNISNNIILGPYVDGAGIYNYGTLSINNSTISENVSQGRGGGIASAGVLTINNSTIARNVASSSGGGLYLGLQADKTSMKNSILANNSAGLTVSDCSGNLKSDGYNIIGNNLGCTITSASGDLLNVDPKLGPYIQDLGYIPLTSTSPAIDAASNASCPVVDQRGQNRFDGDGNGSAVCDIGAYEYRMPGSAAIILTVDGNDQYAYPNTAFPKPLSAVVLDSVGNLVTGQQVVFKMPVNGASSMFLGSGTTILNAATNQYGTASTSLFVANGNFGFYVATAEISGLGISTDFDVENSGWFVSVSTGSDSNDCKYPVSPCATINYVLEKVANGDTIKIMSGTYIGVEPAVVSINKPVALSGGWDATFTTQAGYSIIDGEGVDDGIYTTAFNVFIERLKIQNGNRGIVSSGSLIINNCIVESNLFGGILNGGILEINNSQISLNSEKGVGNMYTAKLTINDTKIYNNQGFGVSNDGIANLMHVYVYNNQQGGIYNSQGIGINPAILTVENSSIHSNDSNAGPHYRGAGLYNEGTATLRNVTISNNLSVNGAGVYSYGNTTIVNSTITGNIASYRGGGVSRDANAGTLSIINTLIADNQAANMGDDCYGQLTSTGNNLIGTTESCTVTAKAGDKFNINPKLGTFIPSLGYHPIQSGSPAIDAAKIASCPAGDQRGQSRVDGDGNGSNVCDIGAYEFIASGSAAHVVAAGGYDQHAAPGKAFLLPLKAVVTDSNGTPVSGVTVNFIGPGPVSYGSAVTDAGGLATSGVITAKEELGDYVISASVAGIGQPADFNLSSIIWFVSPTGNNTVNSCKTPSTPCLNLQGALNKAGFYSGDEIRMSIGTYDSASQITIRKNTTIVGGWNMDFTQKVGASVIEDGIWITPRMNVVLKNLTIQNTNIYGVYNQEGVLRIENSTIRLNTVGVQNWIGQIVIVNSTISDNDSTESGLDGGISNNGGNSANMVTLIGSTVTRNKTSSAGGIANDLDNSPAQFKVINSIITGNSVYYHDGRSPDCSGKFTSLGYNLIGNIGNDSNTCDVTWKNTDQFGRQNSPLNPLLDVIQEFGDGIWVYPLMSGSPAIDAGNPATPGLSDFACASADQRGIARPQLSGCDIGAYEYVPNHSLSQLLLITYNAGHTIALPGIKVCDESDLSCSAGDVDAQKAHIFAAGVYDFYQVEHGRNSIDDQGVELLSSIHYGTGYQNAFWNGYMVVYGDGFSRADDIVAHEFTHGVTQYESNLFYWYQSGAINESFSDLWGEAYDQANSLGNDSNTVKWLIGEDITGLGEIRSMKDPAAFGDPDKLTSSHYVKNNVDNGGVHSNSGVNNKAAYLMVDGGTFNGVTVSALGWNKVLAIYYEVQTNLLTSGSDYLDLYNALNQACINKIGTNGITNADCQQVSSAVLAVQMNKEPVAGFNPSLPYACKAGTNLIANLYQEDFESGTDGWVLPSPQWNLSSYYAVSGPGSAWANDSAFTKSAYSLQQTNPVAIPNGLNTLLQFKHAYGFEYGKLAGSPANFDGGVVEYSINGGAWKDASSLFSAGQNYNGAIAANATSGNPLAGKKAFVNESHGYVDTRYDLTSLAGKNVIFRWRAGTDYIGSYNGWFIDDIQITTCQPIGKPALVAPKNKMALKNNFITLDWKDIPNVTGYTIQVSKSSTFAGKPLINAIVANSSYTPIKAPPVNTTLYWRVSGNTPSGAGPWSTTFSFITGNPPAAPTLMIPSNTSESIDTTPLFDWSNSKIPAGTKYKSYQLQMSTDPSFSYLALNATVRGTATNSKYIPANGLLPGATYYWRVRTYNTLGQYSNWSNTFSFNLLPAAPLLISPSQAQVFSSIPVTLDWDDAVGAAGYTIEISSAEDFSPALESSSTAVSEYVTSNALPADGTPIYWRVRSDSSAGSSNWITGNFSVSP